MRTTTLFQRGLALERTVVEHVEFDEELDAVIVHARPRKGATRRCGHCQRRSPIYDQGGGRRRWRGLDLGMLMVFIEAAAPRVRCRDHGVVVASVPWARHGAGHTLAFDQTAAWLAVHTSKSAVVKLLRVAWRTVGAIVARTNADIEVRVDRLDGLVRIGIDEISYKRNYLYLTVVVDHDTGRLVWADPGRDMATVERFFDALGPERAAQITHVSADMAAWIANVVEERAPNAIRCADPFHVVKKATEALDVVRRDTWNQARGRRRSTANSPRRPRAKGDARKIKNTRYALWKNPEDLTARQQHQLDWIAKTEPRLHRAYLLKEGLRYVFKVKGDEGKQALDAWISWARRSRIPAFVELQRTIVEHRAEIDATLDCGLSNALIESTNTKIRLLTRVAFGFKDPKALIALAMLSLGGQCPDLPGRI